MNADDFWNLIEQARSTSPTTAEIPQLVEQRLLDSQPEEIADFAAWLGTYLNVAHDRRLRVAANIICGMIGDDSFTYFKCWLIAQGRPTYERALRDPDSLAELNAFSGQGGSLPLLESLVYVATRPFTEKTGGHSPAQLKVILPQWRPPVGTLVGPVPLAASDFWNGDKHELKACFPKLLTRFPAQA